MSADETIADGDSADEQAILNAMKSRWQSSSPAPVVAGRVRQEKRREGSVKRRDGRSVRHGSHRDTQINIKAAGYVKARLTAYCARRGIAITDWFEELVMALELED
jgi:hypothetical protein